MPNTDDPLGSRDSRGIESTAYCRGSWDPNMHLSLSPDVLQTTHAVRGIPGQLSLQGSFYYIFSSLSTQIFMFV